jgi:hypothetical protein
MRPRPLALGLVVVGLILLGMGLAWNRVVPSTAYWNDDRAREYTAAQAELHSIHPRGHEHEAQLQAARDRFLKIYEQLEQARGTRNRTAALLKAVGISLLLLGVLLQVKSSQDE